MQCNAMQCNDVTVSLYILYDNVRDRVMKRPCHGHCRIICYATIALLFCILQWSCYESVENTAVHSVSFDKVDVKDAPISDWYVCGTFSEKDAKKMDSLINVSDVASLQGIENPDTLNTFWFNGLYTPNYKVLDISEMFGVKNTGRSKLLQGKSTYLFCDIVSDKNVNVYMQVKSRMLCTNMLNGKLLKRRRINGLDIYPVTLKKGINKYIVKVVPKNENYSIETVFIDSSTVAKKYVDAHSNNFLLPTVNVKNHNVVLTGNHRGVLNSDVSLAISDAEQRQMYSCKLRKDSLQYHVPSLETGKSYLCRMTIAGQTVNQPIVCGHFRDAYNRLQTIRKKIPAGNPRLDEIDQIFFRLDYLLHNNNVVRDLDWQYKIPILTYQLEVIFANLNSTKGYDKGEFNIQFKAYRSELDGNVQRYLLARPNELERGKKYPLVVIVRPTADKYHPFMINQQVARQNALNELQSLANRYNYIVIMPEARMYVNEELVPIVEKEFELAIEDVKKHYPIDEDRVYLHANCSGGYRALRLACNNVGKYAAIALYAPQCKITHISDWSERTAPENHIDRFGKTPMFIMGDPIDTHSPYDNYAAFIDECKKNMVPLTVSLVLNSGYKYNKALVGEEAFQFFRGKARTVRANDVAENDTSSLIMDFYSSPYVYVYNKSNKSESYQKLVKNICKDYEDNLHSSLPLVADTDVDKDLLLAKNVFFIGTQFNNPIINECLKEVERNNNPDFNGGHSNISLFVQPFNQIRKVIVLQTVGDDCAFLPQSWLYGVLNQVNFKK